MVRRLNEIVSKSQKTIEAASSHVEDAHHWNALANSHTPQDEFVQEHEQRNDMLALAKGLIAGARDSMLGVVQKLASAGIEGTFYANQIRMRMEALITLNAINDTAMEAEDRAKNVVRMAKRAI